MKQIIPSIHNIDLKSLFQLSQKLYHGMECNIGMLKFKNFDFQYILFDFFSQYIVHMRMSYETKFM